MNHRNLPPLKSLVFFESATRHQSFTRASEELNVTQGAVSRQIRLLEKFLGTSLFRRVSRQIILTDDGHNYYLAIAHLLRQLELETTAIKGPAEPNQITFVTSSALAPMYLLPRLPDFREKYADIPIRIVARDSIEDLKNFNFDLGLYYCRDIPKELDAVPLFSEKVFPVCSPNYQRQNKDRLKNRDALATDLIWLESDQDWINWPEWLNSMDIHIGQFNNKLVVNHYPMVIQAAISGQGIALAWAHLVDDDIKRGSLLKPFDLALETGSNFYLISPPDKTLNSKTQLFRDWLIENHSTSMNVI